MKYRLIFEDKSTLMWINVDTGSSVFYWWTILRPIQVHINGAPELMYAAGY